MLSDAAAAAAAPPPEATAVEVSYPIQASDGEPIQMTAVAVAAPSGMTRGEAEAAATAEGLQLIPSSGPTGYKGVSPHEPAMRHGLEESRYFAQFKGGGTLAPLGYFSSPHEAALAYARYVGAEGCAAAVATVPPASVPQTAEEAIEAARAEGLVLVRAANATGYRGVKKNASGHTKPYEARVRRDGKNEHLGTFACAEAAALAYARRLGPQETGELAARGQRPSIIDRPAAPRALMAPAPPPVPPPAAGDVGISGLREVTAQPASPPAALGVPVAPEPAAAAYRSLAAEAPAPAPAPAVAAASAAASSATDLVARATTATAMTVATMTVEQAAAQAAAEGLQLLTGDTRTGYRYVVRRQPAKGGRERAKPYQAQHFTNGKQVSLGYFSTAHEAALAYARHVGPEGIAQAAAQNASRLTYRGPLNGSTNYFGGDASPEGAAGPNLSDLTAAAAALPLLPGSGGGVEVPGMHDVGVGAVPVAGTSEGALRLEVEQSPAFLPVSAEGFA